MNETGTTVIINTRREEARQNSKNTIDRQLENEQHCMHMVLFILRVYYTYREKTRHHLYSNQRKRRHAETLETFSVMRLFSFLHDPMEQLLKR